MSIKHADNISGYGFQSCRNKSVFYAIICLVLEVVDLILNRFAYDTLHHLRDTGTLGDLVDDVKQVGLSGKPEPKLIEPAVLLREGGGDIAVDGGQGGPTQEVIRVDVVLTLLLQHQSTVPRHHPNCIPIHFNLL
jgi:hypothetical protein